MDLSQANLLFLDFDGVFNNTKFLKEQVAKISAGEKYDHWKHMVDPVAVCLLASVVHKHDLHICISSSWRLMLDKNGVEWPLSLFSDELSKHGLRAKWVGRTPWSPLPDSDRGTEILEWLKEYGPVRRYAVIDDDADAGFGHEKYFVKTNFKEGITQKHVDQLDRLFST